MAHMLLLILCVNPVVSQGSGRKKSQAFEREEFWVRVALTKLAVFLALVLNAIGLFSAQGDLVRCLRFTHKDFLETASC